MKTPASFVQPTPGFVSDSHTEQLTYLSVGSNGFTVF